MTFTFSAKKRKDNEEASALRFSRQLPAILYGSGMKPISLAMDYNGFFKLYNEAGEASLIDLAVDGASPVKVLIQDLQQDPVKGVIIHVDFRKIDMNKEMHATCELRFIGEAPAVKELAGTLVKAKDTVEVKCLPKDLVNEITVDLNVLKTFEDVVHVKDLMLPAGITLTDDPKTVIVKVARPLSEEELKAMDEQGPKSVEEVEVEKKGKEEVEGEGETEAGEKKDEGKKEEKKKE